MTLRIGSRGEEVKKLQHLLHLTEDGVFGKKTEEAVKKFQKDNGLVADGIVGNRTWAILLKQTSEEPKPNPLRFVILLDNGHGSNTAGKRSPDGKFREYRYCRDRAAEIAEVLKAKGYDVRLIVTEEWDVPLASRASRVNEVCRKYGADRVLLVSLHTDAAPGSGWSSARGLSVRVSPKASDKSKKLARLLYEAGDRRNLRGNRSVPGCKYWVQNLYILNNSNCPAVLTETLFQNNKQDVDFLLSEQGKKAVVDYHVEGIINYIKSL